MSEILSQFKPHPEIACSEAEFNPAIHKAVYRHNYPKMFADIDSGKLDRVQTLRYLIKNDLFFIAYFVAGWEDGKSSGNRPFIVNMCKEDEDGPQTGVVDIYAREHGKSSVLNIAKTVQRVVNDPECSTVIFSFRKSSAEKFLISIKNIFESDLMIDCFPEIFYKDPSSSSNGSPKWSQQEGIRVKRKNQIKREHTVEAFGLVEGSPIGGHYDHRIYDDIETEGMARSPEQLVQCYESLLMSRALGREGGTERIIGTYYSHCGVLVKLSEKLDIHGNNMYQLRIKPATNDGTINGAPVFFTQEYLDDKKTDLGFSTQYLCDPTPGHDVKLKYECFKQISRSDLPPNRVKFVIIDPAGDREVITGRNSDNWAMLTVSITPDKDDLGFSDVFIEDGIVDTFDFPVAINAACALYRRSGRVSLLAIEQVGQSSQYRNIMDNLKKDYGVYLDIKKKNQYGGNLLLLTPKSKGKNYRIASAISSPLVNGKIHIVDDLVIKLLLKAECEKFPFFHVDILDALAYLYDILADPTTPMILSGDRKRDRPVNEIMGEMRFRGVW